jgi:ribosome-binding factor A
MDQSPQTRRNNEAVRSALADILLYEISDPRVSSLTVSGAVVSSDRSVARVYVLADRVEDSVAMAGLESAKGRIRSLLGARLGWRQTPELRFFIDPMLEHASRIEAVLKDAPPTLDVSKDEDGYPVIEDAKDSDELPGD